MQLKVPEPEMLRTWRPDAELPLDWPQLPWQETDPAEMVMLSALRPADSPRQAGEDADHVRTLAQVDGLPPIVVHRHSMRVIDGMHRLRAAQTRGAEQIAVRYYHGSEDSAFVLAVYANVAHGLPLSLADRAAAAGRILQSHPHWSDRAIGAGAGLAAKTVSVIRERNGNGVAQPAKRLGRDGRLRPVDSSPGRLLASRVIADHPEASLREVARLAGISPGTARDVRDRIRSGIDPIPASQRDRNRTRRAERRPTAPVAMPRDQRLLIIRKLLSDPSLRFTDTGRSVLRWLCAQTAAIDDTSRLDVAIPGHAAHLLADLACGMAAEWLGLAERLRRNIESTPECPQSLAGLVRLRILRTWTTNRSPQEVHWRITRHRCPWPRTGPVGWPSHCGACSRRPGARCWSCRPSTFMLISSSWAAIRCSPAG